MAARRRLSSLADLPTKVAIRIAGRLAATLVRPVDELRAFLVTCRFMRCVCSDPEVLISIKWLSDNMYWDDPYRFFTLLPCLAQSAI